MTIPERPQVDLNIEWAALQLRWIDRSHYKVQLRFLPKLVERAALEVADSLDYLRATIDGFHAATVEYLGDGPYTIVELTMSSARKLLAVDPATFKREVESRIRAGIEKASIDVKADADATLPWLQAVTGVERPRFGLTGRSG